MRGGVVNPNSQPKKPSGLVVEVQWTSLHYCKKDLMLKCSDLGWETIYHVKID